MNLSQPSEKFDGVGAPSAAPGQRTTNTQYAYAPQSELR